MTIDYASTVQVDIDAIVAAGDIKEYIDALSLLFPNVYGAYMGTDSKPHMISYYVNSLQLGGVGYIPTGTDASAMFKIDATQKPYSMQPIINYMNAYYTLAAYATENNDDSVELNLGTYNQFTGSYDALKTFLDSFGGTYTATLYQFATSQDDLSDNMAAIRTQLFYPEDDPPNITTFVENLETDFAQTIPYIIGQAEQSLVQISRTVAYNARRGQNHNVIIPG